MKIKKFEQFNIEEDYLKIIKKCGLEEYLKVVLLNNKSNNAPYHNLYHTLCVMKNSYNIAKSEGLSKNEIKLIVIAALFHDIDHSLGEKTDEENVKHAISIFKKYSKEEDRDNEIIIDIIKATQYPYVIKDDDLNESQKIIRDADMMQCFEDNVFQQILLGLMTQEFKVKINEVPKKQIAFLKSVKFYTDYAVDIADEKMKKIISDFEFIDKIIND